MKEKITQALIIVGMLLIVAGILIPLITKSIESDIFRYIFSAGALLHLIGRMFTTYDGDNMRLKRLYRIESWSAIFFCVAAFFMFYDPTNMRDPLVFTVAGGLVQVYTSIMIPIVSKKQ